MIMESYAFTTADVKLIWKPNPVQWEEGKSFVLPDFDFVKAVPSDCTAGYVTGSFSCLKVAFHIHRKIGYYMVQLYVPSCLIVILSWVSFWIDVNATPARVSLGLLTVLTMTTQSARFPTPRVSYVKALDIWSSFCLIFVFGALLEFAIVNVMAREDKHDQEKALRKQKMAEAEQQRKEEENETGFQANGSQGRSFVSKIAPRADSVSPLDVQIHSGNSLRSRHPESTKANSNNPENGHTSQSLTKERHKRNKAENVDYISRYVFPSLFIIFNALYWILYRLVLQ